MPEPASPIERLKAQLATLSKNPTFRFDPPSDEATVRAAEEALGVIFPEDYRNFLLEVASGHGNGSFRFARSRAEAEGRTRQSFPFTWEQARQGLLIGPSNAGGSFLVWDHGCGEESHLVIVGAERGHVWRVTEDGWRPDGDPEMAAPLAYCEWLEWWLTVW